MADSTRSVVPKITELPSFTNRSVMAADSTDSRFSRDRDIVDVFRQGAKQLAAEQMQAAKTSVAVHLSTQIYEHALQVSDAFMRRAYERLESNSRSDECQAQYESLHQSLMARYNAHINGIVEVGVTAIARETHKDVIVPRPEKRGWLR